MIHERRWVSPPVSLWVWGGVRPWINHYMADSTSFSFTTKTSISLFVENKNPLSVPHQRDCGLWITWCPGEILTVNWLLGHVAGWASVPLHRRAVGLHFHPFDLTANFVCRWGNWSPSKWFANPQMCAEWPCGHQPQDWLSWRVPWLPPQFSLYRGGRSDDDRVANHWLKPIGTGAGTTSQRALQGQVQEAFWYARLTSFLEGNNGTKSDTDNIRICKL
jgi:hypothetical protein